MATVIRILGLLLLLSSSSLAAGQAFIPEPLGPWVDWVKESTPDLDCPSQYASFSNRQCLWAGVLSLSLDESGGSFSQDFTAYAETWLLLPGDRAHWPEKVLLDGNESSLVLNRNGRPAMRVESGPHRLSGHFSWRRLPPALSLPADTGLVDLTIKGEPSPVNRDRQGRLWLKSQQRDSVADQTRDQLKLKVQRHISDFSPMRLDTRLVLDVSGKQREQLLPSPLLEGFIPIDLNSRLPARLEADGSLRLQLRPGHWELMLSAYRPGEVLSLTRPDAREGWPEEEVWVFAAQNDLRLVEPEGLSQIDPRQTSLPGNWQQLPAFLAKPGDQLRFKLIRRGDPDPAPDRLSLQRTLWLDFEGSGYSLQDQLTGTISQTWRLESSPLISLGRVAIDGNDQNITRRVGSDALGVEVRRGHLNLTADSRYEGPINSMPLGWQHDFNSASAQLNLPPGWDVFSVSGVDNNPPTWVQRWTMLDLFLVLIASIAVSRLWGLAWGAVALLSLALTWHAAGAPQLIWLHLIAAMALLRAVPEGKLHALVAWYRNIAFLLLVVIAIPFMVNQARIGIYPQLEQATYLYRALDVTARDDSAPTAREAPAKMKADAQASSPAMMLDKRDAVAPLRSMAKIATGAISSVGNQNQALDIRAIDPNANVQTGPGLPKWQWRSLQLSWNGPLLQSQEVGLVLISPGQNLLIHFGRILLILALAALLLLDRASGGPRGWLSSLREVSGLLHPGKEAKAPGEAAAGEKAHV